MAAFVYIMTNRPNGVLYIGVTTDLERRVAEHKQCLGRGFTARYGCTRLVWFEEWEDVRDAIHREKALKRWLRAWKVRLILEQNPDWRDLAADWWAKE